MGEAKLSYELNETQLDFQLSAFAYNSRVHTTNNVDLQISRLSISYDIEIQHR
jgi:hypothetical protein